MTDASHDRSKFIGSSDVAAILGRNPWKTPYQVWLDKMGRSEEPDERTQELWAMGQMMEQPIISLACEVYGLELDKSNTRHIHTGGLIAAEVDAWMRDLDGPDLGGRPELFQAEVKSGLRSWPNKKLPDHYWVQIQTAMACTGADHVLVISYLASKLDTQWVERDQEFIDEMIPRVTNWWNDHVVTGIPPEPSTGEESYQIYPVGAEDSVDVAADLVAEYLAAGQLKSEAEKRYKAIQDSIRLALGPASYGSVDGQVRVTWKTQYRTAFDQKKFQQDYPELFEKYSMREPIRVLRSRAS